jgi:hypothetical protein
LSTGTVAKLYAVFLSDNAFIAIFLTTTVCLMPLSYIPMTWDWCPGILWRNTQPLEVSQLSTGNNAGIAPILDYSSLSRDNKTFKLQGTGIQESCGAQW